MFTAVYLCLGLFWSLFGHKNHPVSFYPNRNFAVGMLLYYYYIYNSIKHSFYS